MAQYDTGGAKTGGPRRPVKRTPSAPPPRQADQGDRSRSRPAPRPVVKPAPAFRGPVTSTRPFAAQQQQAQQTVRATRRRLPAPPLAQPPIISAPAGTTTKPSGAPLPRAKVEAFLKGQGKVTQAARHQIVGSIRAQVGNAKGQDRVDALDRILDEIATDPRLHRTRAAIRHYTALERAKARPNTGEAKPGPPDKKIHGPGPLGFASVNTTAVSRAAAAAGEKIAPGLKGHSPPVEFVKNAIQDVGTIGSAPFVGGYHMTKAAVSDVAHLRDPLHGEVAQLHEDVAKGVVENWSHPAKYFKEHPVLFVLDATGALSILGHGAGAAARSAGKVGAPGIRGGLAKAGQTTRSPLAHGDDLAAGITERRFSKDSLKKMVQVAQDKGLEPLRDPQGNVVTVEQNGRHVVVLKPKEGAKTLLHPRVGPQGSLNVRRADVHASRTNALERHERDVEGKDRRVRGLKGKAAKHVVSMVTRGVITAGPHFQADLVNYVTRIRGKLAQHDLEVAQTRANPSHVYDGPYRHEGEVEKARANADLVDKVLHSPKTMAQVEAIVGEGVRHGGALVAQDTEAAGAGLFEGGIEQATRARLIETAVEHMGGKHYTVEEHAALEKTGRQAETAAAEKYSAASKAPALPPRRSEAAAEALTERQLTEQERNPGPTADLHARMSARTHALSPLRARVGVVEFERLYYQKLLRDQADAQGLGLPVQAAILKEQAARVRQVADVAEHAAAQTGHESAAVKVLMDWHGGDWGGPAPKPVPRGTTAQRAALDEMNTAREHRIAVSGRDPVRVRAHESARAARSTAQRAANTARDAETRIEQHVGRLAAHFKSERAKEAHHGPVAAYHVGPQRFALLKDAVAYAKANGIPVRNIQRVALSASEAKRVGQLSNARRALKTARARRRAADKAVRLTERAARENPMPEASAGVRRSGGTFLPTSEIEDFLRSRGRDPDTVAYLPPNVSRRAHHKQFRPDNRGTLTGDGTRTGAQASKGAVENSPEILRAAGVRHVTTLNQARSIDRLISEHGQVHPAVAKAKAGLPLTPKEQRVVAEGGYFNGKEAAEIIDRTKVNENPKYVAIRAYPGKLPADIQRMIREDFQGPGGMETLGLQLMNDRFIAEGDLGAHTSRNVVLVDAQFANRLLDHLKPRAAVWSAVNKAFRYAVLPQIKWIFGEFFEPLVVRLTASGSGLNVFGLGADLTAATKYLRAGERSGNPAIRAEVAAIRAQHMGGMVFGNRGIRRTPSEIAPALAAKAEAGYAKMVEKLPATRHLAEIGGTLLKGTGKAIMAPLDAIFYVTRTGESELVQRAALGNTVRREIHEFTGDWIETIKLSQKAIEDVQAGHVGTAAQHRLLDRSHELVGKYEGFGPTLRGATQGALPFIPWALSAARFVYWTMPAHHPALTAYLIRVNNVMQKDWDEIHKGAPPGMAMAIPNGKGGWIDLARFSPYGLSGPLAKGEFRGITSTVLPQLSGVQSALENRDPFGRPLQMSDHRPAGGGDKLGVALNAALEAFFPYLSKVRVAQEHGETAYADSTALTPRTKPGTSHGSGAVSKMVNPIRPTYLHRQSATEVPEPAPAQGPQTPREAMLARRAARRAGGHTDRSAAREAMLKRRARRLNGG